MVSCFRRDLESLSSPPEMGERHEPVEFCASRVSRRRFTCGGVDSLAKGQDAVERRQIFDPNVWLDNAIVISWV